MSWAVGYDNNWKRDIGYGVPATCDHQGCGERIDRGLAYVCARQEPYGGLGCGLFFCGEHTNWEGFCERCSTAKSPFDPTPDLPEWLHWKLEHESWAKWREDCPDELSATIEALASLETRGRNEAGSSAPAASIPASGEVSVYQLADKFR